MTQAFRRTYSFSECVSFRAWRKYPAAIANSTHIELWAAPSSQMSRQVIAGLWPSMCRMPNVAYWHKAAIDSVVWKVRKGSELTFAAAKTNDRCADGAVIRPKRSDDWS